MLIAHGPSGYIVSKIVKRKSNASFVVCSLIFSLWPDLDLIYYYIFDKAKTFHHTYFPHLPIVLFACFIVTIPLINTVHFKHLKEYYIIFFANWALHLILDTFTGGILWLYPFSSKLFALFVIPPTSPNWVVSFILHWSFLIELAIVLSAGALLTYSWKKKRGRAGDD